VLSGLLFTPQTSISPGDQHASSLFRNIPMKPDTTDYARTEHNLWQFLITHGLVISCLFADHNLLFLPQHMPENMVVFYSGRSLFAIPTSLITTIQQLGSYTPLPFTQPHIVGTKLFQDKMLLVLSLVPHQTHQKTSRLEQPVLIVHLEGRHFGLLVDELLSADIMLTDYLHASYQ
jgi:hypothetical protein